MADRHVQPQEGELLFVYAADSGLFNTLTDIAHKILSPSTYNCDLCALTHGYFREREEWTSFVASLSVPCRYLHRDEAADLPDVMRDQLPAIYRYSAGHWKPCLLKQGIEACQDLEQLQQQIVANCVCAGP